MAENTATLPAVRRTHRMPLSKRLPLVFLALLVFAGVFGPLLAPYDPTATNSSEALSPPSLAHWFGTDQLGRDVFSRTLAATRTDLLVGAVAVSISLVLGTMIGALAGWRGGRMDVVLGRFVDSIMAFPLFVLAVGIAAGLGNSLTSVIVATAIVNLPFYARAVRFEVARRRNAGWVEAALLARIPPVKIVTFHILPNLVALLATQSSLNMGWAILNAAGLSFIGLGIRPPEAEWGIMVADGASYIFSGEWWVFTFPGLALMSAVLIFTRAGDALRQLLDPRSK
ncbi:ABC transporter permease [Celeribacter litoreus]|uniref:ABC transporter permease n=1 Tax=Celeribacter litoreus TaxID=2876714 RepID=UPI001CCE5F49|nr:ABC transporter permease [Celeribacter litoreus]MCA0042627.1 ABC transporter permease [Celeribacter litoreus]